MALQWVTCSPEETVSLAEQIGRQLQAGDVLAYRGDLGAGKTTFTRGLALGMGIDELVTSPTFALVHCYGQPPLQLVHFDMYRIDSEDELETTGFYDHRPEESVFAVEWSEHIPDALPPHTIQIRLERLGDTERRITLTAEGEERFADIGH